MNVRDHFLRAGKSFKTLSAIDKKWVAAELRRTGQLLSRVDVERLMLALLAPKGVKVFLSHSHKDKPFVRSLAKKLESHGITVWLDEADLKVGESLIERLSKAVEDVDFVVAVLSAHSVQSRWVKKELLLAMSDQISTNQIKVLPVLKDASQVPHYLRGRLFADFSTAYKRQRNFPALLESLRPSQMREFLSNG